MFFSKSMHLLETDVQADMEAEMAILLPQGALPKSVVEVVAKVLTKDCPKSTFLKNVGLQSGSSSKLNKFAHVLDLEEQLKRSQDQSAEMKEELAAIKKKSQEEVAAAEGAGQTKSTRTAKPPTERDQEVAGASTAPPETSLQAAMNVLATPIAQNIDPAAAQAELEAQRQKLLSGGADIIRAQRELNLTLREYNAAHGTCFRHSLLNAQISMLQLCLP